jgi:hypothetical protein
MERAHALVQGEMDAVLDELQPEVAARAAGSPEVQWGELRAALEDEGLSVEELRSEWQNYSQPDGAQGGQGPLVRRLTAAVILAAEQRPAAVPAVVGAIQLLQAPGHIPLATLMDQVKGAAAEAPQPSALVEAPSDLVAGKLQFQQQFEEVMRARYIVHGKKMFSKADVGDMKRHLLLNDANRKLARARINEADGELLLDEDEANRELARARIKGQNSKYRKIEARFRLGSAGQLYRQNDSKKNWVVRNEKGGLSIPLWQRQWSP